MIRVAPETERVTPGLVVPMPRLPPLVNVKSEVVAVDASLIVPNTRLP